MAIPAFDEKEMEVASVIPASPFSPEIACYTYPVTPKEAMRSAMAGKPYWQVGASEGTMMTNRVLADNIARGFCFEARPFDPNEEGGGKDIFGIEWIYEPVAAGSMVFPGNPLFTDANEWVDKVVWPDINSWDWAAAGEANNGTFFTDEKYNYPCILNGFFERLISFMDFENAAFALVDEDQKEAVKAFFERLSDFYIELIDKFVETFPGINGFQIHDDWGSQKNTFFSPAIAEEMIVPYMKKVTDHIHSKGLYAELHSCGQLDMQVPNIAKAGWDAWCPQAGSNDSQMLYDKYGDLLLIGVLPDPVSLDMSEEEQYQAGVDYANRFCKPEKPSILNMYVMFDPDQNFTPKFWEGLYRQSRINYGG